MVRTNKLRSPPHTDLSDVILGQCVQRPQSRLGWEEGEVIASSRMRVDTINRMGWGWAGSDTHLITPQGALTSSSGIASARSPSHSSLMALTLPASALAVASSLLTTCFTCTQ